MTNLDSILKSRDIILPTKVHTAKAVILEKTLKMALKHVKYHV